MTQNNDLREELRALAEAAPKNAGSSVEQQLLARFRTRRRNQRRRIYFIWAAACVVLAAGLYSTPWRARQATRSVLPKQTEAEFGFIALPYAQSGVPMEQPVIVRVDIPVSELGMVGVPFAPSGAKQRVKADLLVGQDGVARAVRFVH